jgi:hypothetical protein
MNRFRKSIAAIIIGVLTLALVAGVAFAGFGQTPQTVSAAPAAAQATVVPATTAAATPSAPKAGRPSQQDMSEAAQYFMPVISAVSTTLNLSPLEIASQLQAGKSVADIAKAQNVDLQKVKDALTGAVKTQLDAVVKAGKATQPQADKVGQTLNIWVDELLNASTASIPSNVSHKDLESYATPILNATASALNLTPEQLKSEVQAGKSLADIAKAQNVDLQKVKDAALNSGKTQLDAAVKAGKVTQSQADKLYQTATLWIDELVNGKK